MGLRDRLRRVPTCTRCRRPHPCACASIVRGHVKAAKRAHRPSPTPTPCPNPWCDGRMRPGGVCTNPDC